jgi:hypothetical protein
MGDPLESRLSCDIKNHGGGCSKRFAQQRRSAASEEWFFLPKRDAAQWSDNYFLSKDGTPLLGVLYAVQRYSFIQQVFQTDIFAQNPCFPIW